MADNTSRPRPPPNRRRDKAQLSCDPCRHRKLKCDRQRPCGACSRRGVTSSCNYAMPSSKSSTLSTQPLIAPPRNTNLHGRTSSLAPRGQRSTTPRQSTTIQGRITELENLVITLMNDQSPSNVSTPTSLRGNSLSFASVRPEVRTSNRPQDEVASHADPGTLKSHESGTSYVQSAHWEAILAKIQGLKEDLIDGSKAPPGSHLFYGPNRHATRDEIFAAVPPRTTVDRLLALHFESQMVTPYIIHSKKFLREYETFWKDPSTTSIAWIGLMFAMLYITAQLQIFTTDMTDGRDKSFKGEYLTMRDAFREKAVQCLILARYTTGGPYILETLLIFLIGESLLVKNSATDGWLMISMCLHIAMRMGYHRDPDHFPEISPFEAEMRRRVWTTILQLDLVLSLEKGVPRNATDEHIDTDLPLNLRDCDFDEDTTEMPPPRPDTEFTPILALISKGQLISVLGLICDVNTDINPPSYDKLVEIDALLEDVHKRRIPSVFRWGTTPLSITDSPAVVFGRISVQTTYYKSRILLHRRALIGYSARESNEHDRESVKICLDSALEILSFQQVLHDESQPFGRLYNLRWKVALIFNLDVLLATSVLCLYLQDAEKFEVPGKAGQATCSPRAEEIRQKLTFSHEIWLQLSSTSAEARKVAKALSIVLENAETLNENGSDATMGDFLTDLNALPLYDFGANFNNQYIPPGFYSPLTYFDNVLETRGM